MNFLNFFLVLNFCMDLAVILRQREGLTIITLLLIVVAVATVFCLLSAIACLIAASREMELPDIEDTEIAE